MRHTHAFRRFVLYDTLDHGTIKVFTSQPWRREDYWYAGYECRCGERGYTA